jgi:hypothetical protein
MDVTREVREMTRARGPRFAAVVAASPISLDVMADPTLVELIQRCNGNFPNLE